MADRVESGTAVTRFEGLEAWKESRRLVGQIYKLTRQSDIKQDFGLISQIQRAAVSIMTNIAEGFERYHIQEKMQFYNIARASTGEVRSLLYVIEDNYPEYRESAEQLRNLAIHIGKLLSGLIQSTQARK